MMRVCVCGDEHWKDLYTYSTREKAYYILYSMFNCYNTYNISVSITMWYDLIRFIRFNDNSNRLWCMRMYVSGANVVR